MKKQKMQLLVLLAVLVALGAGFFGIRKYNELQSLAGEEEKGIQVTDMSLNEIIRFSYDYEEETYSFEKEEETWYVEGDHSIRLVQSSINSMLEDAAPVTATQVIEKVTDMSQYGLQTPSRTIRLETASESCIFYVGDYNELSGSYYICSPSETSVYVVPALTVNRFNKTLEDLKEPEEVQTESTEAAAE